MNNYITKIEGHGKLNINFAKNIAVLEIDEGERLFEGLLIGRNFTDGPFLTARICGICPTAHHLASTKAIENALGINPSESAIILRKMMLLAQIFQSHNLHLFFLALPDYYHLDSSLDIAKKFPMEFAIVLRLKQLADEILKTIGGRSVHPITPVIGGFAKKISLSKLSNIRNKINQCLDEAENLITIFENLDYPKFENPSEYLALSNLGTKNTTYPLYSGKIISSDYQWFDENDFDKIFKEEIRPYSTAKFALRDNKPQMVGALARLVINHESLNPLALNRFKKAKIDIFAQNPFYNNFAQSIEILNCLEEIKNLIEQFLRTPQDIMPKKFKIKAGKGVGVVEAPRGILYHYYEIDDNAKIKDVNIITPTVLNLANLEKDAQKLILDQVNLEEPLSKDERTRQIEMLIRAYDPCITCSVH
jgi:coenzyme F420-reducing hydrogenase alpha subunit